MTNAKPNNVFAERDALLRENEQLRKEIGNLQSQRNICLAAAKEAQRQHEQLWREYNRLSDQNRATEEINARMRRQNEQLRARPCPFVVTSDELSSYCSEAERVARELEAARKVADAALHYFDVDADNAEWDREAFCALDDAVCEYRARVESNGKETEDARAIL